MPAFLPEIVAAHRMRAAADPRDPEALLADAARCPAPLPFREALRVGSAPDGTPGLAVVAEVKRRSPSMGELAAGLDPAAAAADYAAGGAAALSVLTDRDHFGGSAEDLVAAKRATGLPALRKDFTVSVADVADARLMGADAVLLIVAALSDGELARFAEAAAALELDALVEVHDEEELARALDAGARLLGVNQRDLRTFEVDSARAERVAGLIPDDVVAVAESGVRGPADARRLAAAGFDAVLVGQRAVTASDRRSAIEELVGHPVGTRAATAR